EIRRTQREKRPFHLLFLDVDGLKAINDARGHLAGDEVLKKVAELLKRTFRKSDIIARIGGDEFVVLVSEVKGRKGLQAVIDRLREKIQAHNQEKRRKYEVSISVGAVRYDGDKPVDIDELLSRADSKMYQEKIRKYRLRENQVVSIPSGSR
ncbi:MAG TPA: GGDEF domain-containing protein, partial [bacterium]|nr:GGDEF domain-containing protein [bacterium]